MIDCRLVGIVCALLLGCEDHALEKEFFRKPLNNRLERLRQYTLKEQFRIFRYGNDVVEPPLTDLAKPIAERGPDAVPFLLERLESEKDDLCVRDILLVLQNMRNLKTHDVSSDARLMSAVTSRVSRMKDADWRAICTKMLERLKSDGVCMRQSSRWNIS